MTRKTRASRNRRVDILLGEHALVMAVVADIGQVGQEELFSIRRMGIVAAGAAHAQRRVDVLLGEHALVMAVVADSGLVGHEELCSVR